MNELVFFLEEPSAEAMLEGLLPRILPGVRYRCIVFEGKQDLEKQLVRRMRGYCVPNARFVVLRDQDSADCHTVKKGLTELCRQAQRPDSLVRIACRELESWYLADLEAVQTGLGMHNLAKLQNKQVYRAPDALPSPACELKKIAPSYQKIGGSRAIGRHLDPNNARSKSFAVFVAGIQRIGGK
jgi:hypothetical protein